MKYDAILCALESFRNSTIETAIRDSVTTLETISTDMDNLNELIEYTLENLQCQHWGLEEWYNKLFDNACIDVVNDWFDAFFVQLALIFIMFQFKWLIDQHCNFKYLIHSESKHFSYADINNLCACCCDCNCNNKPPLELQQGKHSASGKRGHSAIVVGSAHKRRDGRDENGDIPHDNPVMSGHSSNIQMQGVGKSNSNAVSSEQSVDLGDWMNKKIIHKKLENDFAPDSEDKIMKTKSEEF